MKIIHCLDDINTLELSASIKSELIKHLILPFKNQDEAAEYWAENSVCLYVLDQYVEIEFSEYRVVLPSGYVVQLKVLTDKGYYYFTPALV